MIEAEARVLILYTGGTIGMLKTEGGGYAPHPDFLASRFHDPTGDSVWTHSTSAAAFSQWTKSQSGVTSVATTPSLHAGPLDHDPSALPVETADGRVLLPSLVTPRFAQGKRIRYAIYEYERLIDSSEIEPSDFLAIGSDIERNYHHFDGFIVLHGTDTMAFSASALSFLLEDLGKTVILTGAQIPLSELFTDAVDNLLGSLIVAGHYAIPEVCLFFDNCVFRGNRSIKFSSAKFHAFQSPNLPALATVGIDVDVAWPHVLRPGPRPFRAHKAFSSDVATFRFFPGITAAAVRAFLRPGGVRGVVLESYGAGNAPRRPELLAAFKAATEQGIVLVNVSQCITGAVASDIYETGRALAAAGVVGGGDMTTEAALAKLSYLLSKPELTPVQIRKLVAQPLRGEMTPTPGAPTFSSPDDAETRLRTLFSQIVELAPYSGRGTVSPTHHTVTPPDSSSPTLEMPEEFAPAWPTTLSDAEELRGAVMPYLLAQAAGRNCGQLRSLLSSLGSGPSSTALSGSHATSAPLTLPSILNESATSTQQTPLHLAVFASQAENVDLLLSHGASVHVRDVFGQTPLFYAAKLGGSHALEMIRSLRAAGAHLSEQEIESGKVGLEIFRGENGHDTATRELWDEAASEEELGRAKAILTALVA
ncbi:hypothetical protein JCM11251_001234 [Rhodosporidiobolus azoricus]